VSFVLAWLVWNYQFVLVFFSNMLVDEKISYIETFIFSNWYQCLLNGIVMPLIATLFYIFAYPYPAKFVYAFSLRRQKELNEHKQ